VCGGGGWLESDGQNFRGRAGLIGLRDTVPPQPKQADSGAGTVDHDLPKRLAVRCGPLSCNLSQHMSI
jgi:hypothetical protein